MPIVVSVPIGRPKRDIIELAFAQCGLAGYEFDRTPEEQALALRQLNALMLGPPWNALGYAQPTYGVGQVEEPSGLPDDSIDAVAGYLAKLIAPTIGVTLPSEQLSAAAKARSALEGRLASQRVIASRLPGNTVRGSGQSWWRGWPFTPAA